jgi:methylated-DNA-[protein]-cysteine S-methyltransferase
VSWSRVVMPSPVGDLELVADSEALRAVSFLRPEADIVPGDVADEDTIARQAATQLEEYFAGDRRDFDVPLAFRGTDFQQSVWRALLEIPYGTTVCYGDIAARLGLPATASRAVGLANGANPIPIIVPCHRVIGADGSLVGYGGGLDRKRLLLALESPSIQDALFA